MPKYTLVAPPPKAKYTLVAPPPPASESPQAADDPSAAAFERGLSAPPRYFSNATDQAIAETPFVRQVFRGSANTLDTIKSMALRGKAVFNSAIDDRGGAYDALKQADAIDAEKARREAEFQKTSGTAGNIGAGVVESLTLAAPTAMMGGAPAAIGAASASQGNQAYYEGRKAGLTGTNLAQHVAMQTLLEGAPATMSQVVGAGGLEKRLAALGEPVQRGIKAALARFGKTSLEEWPEELTTTLIEQIQNAQAGVGTASPQDLANGALQTTIQTLATAGLVESPSIARGVVDAMRRPVAATPSSDTPANATPPSDMNLTLTPQGEGFEVTNIGRLAEAQQAPTAPTAPAGRRAPDTLPPLPPGAEIPVQGITAPTAPIENPRVAPIAPGSAVLRPVPTLTPEQQAAWMAEAGAMAPAEQEIVADYLMENPGNPDQLSPGEIVARSNRDIWRFTPEQQAEYEKAMGVTAQEGEVIGNEEKGQEAPLLSAETGAGVDVPAPAPSLATKAVDGPIQAIHYSRTPMSLYSDADISKIEGAYSAYEDSTFGAGFYAMEPSDESMWKGMGRFTLGPHRNEVQINPRNPLVISPETVKQRGFDAINEALQSGNHDAIISRGWGDADMRMAVHRRTRQLWKPKFPEGKTEGRFTNVDEFNAAREQAIREVTGINPSDYDKLTKADWDQNQIFVPTKKAPEVVSGATQREPTPTPEPTTPAPIRFKRSGKGNAAVHEATVEGRAVSIAKGKDGWEVRLDGEVADVLPTLADARGYATGELRQDLMDQRNAAEEERSRLPQGPAPADTGIYRDLTAAAREGKRFVAELHERIAPALTRIYQSTSNAMEFIKAAVSKIGEHILPYARKFISEVKRGVRNVNREFRQNPTRGSGPRNLDRAPLANPGTTQEARGFVDRVDEERFAPDEQSRAQWEAEADKLDKNEVLGKLKTGETFQSAAEVIAGKRVTDEAAWNAIYTGENIAESWSIADAWRKTGTQAARILGARYDPILSASEREQISKTNADIAAIDQQLDDPATNDAQFDTLMQQRLDAVQSINDIKMTGTARRMLAEIFTSPRKSTDRKLKKIDKKLEDTTLSPKDRASLENKRDAISKREGRALEEMRRRMLNSGIPLNNPIEMRKRDNILRALSEAKAHKSTFVDKAEELYKNMLFSASTAKNIIANTAFFTSEYGIVRPLEAAINSTIGIDSRAARVSNLGPMIAAAAPGIRRGVRNMIDSWRTEADMFELQTHGPNMNISGKLESRGAAIPGKKGRFIRSLGYRPLMATDSFNKSVIAEIEVANYANSMATEKGLTGRDRVRFIQRQTLDYDSPSWRHAVEVAERLTLTDESGPIVRKATEIRDAWWPLRFILSIIKTPVKEFSRALQMTPLGTARIAAKLYSDPTYTRKYLARDVAEQAAAWTIAIGLYAAFAPGDDDDTGLPVITGNQPYSKRRAAEFKNKAAITPPKSIRIGNRWYSYAALGAPSTALATTVDALEAISDGTGDPLTALSEFMVKFMGNVKDQTFLSNLADIMDAFEEGGFPKWASNFAASWSPSVVKRAVKGMDSTEREMRAMGPMDKLSYQIMPTPYAPAKVDLFGRTVEKPASPFGPRGDLLWRIAGNTQVVDLGQRTPLENDMYRMFLNWNNQHKDERWAPALPDIDYKFGETKGKWSPQEYERLSIMSGQMALKLLTRINSTKPFNFDRPSKTDRERVDKVFEKAREQARKFMISTKIRAGLPKN